IRSAIFRSCFISVIATSSNTSAISADSSPCAITCCHIYWTLTWISRAIAFCIISVSVLLAFCTMHILLLFPGFPVAVTKKMCLLQLCPGRPYPPVGRKLLLGLFRLVGIAQDEISEVVVTVQVELRKLDCQTAGRRPYHLSLCSEGQAALGCLQHDLHPAGGARGRDCLAGSQPDSAHADVDPLARPDGLALRFHLHLGVE